MRTQVAGWLRATADLLDSGKPPTVKVNVTPGPNLTGLALEVLTAHLKRHGAA